MMSISENCYDLTPREIRELNRRNPVVISRKAFAETLRELGGYPGIRLVVHSAFSSLGTFEGGPENFCHALMDMVTEQGTLMMPGLVKYPGDNEKFTYDPLHSPCGFGLVPETFRQMPEVVRSWDPTHSFCVWGKDKIRFVEKHHQYPTMHVQSPLGLLEKAGGYCLTVGCPAAVTFMHVVETSCKAPCLGSRTEQYPAVLPNGERVILRGWGWRKGPCRALQHDQIFAFMRAEHSLAEAMCGRCHLMLFRLADYRRAYSRLLQNPETGCALCPVRPRKVRQTVDSDWDADHDRLIPGEAYTGPFFTVPEQ